MPRPIEFDRAAGEINPSQVVETGVHTVSQLLGMDQIIAEASIPVARASLNYALSGNAEPLRDAKQSQFDLLSIDQTVAKRLEEIALTGSDPFTRLLADRIGESVYDPKVKRYQQKINEARLQWRRIKNTFASVRFPMSSADEYLKALEAETDPQMRLSLYCELDLCAEGATGSALNLRDSLNATAQAYGYRNYFQQTLSEYELKEAEWVSYHQRFFEVTASLQRQLFMRIGKGNLPINIYDVDFLARQYNDDVLASFEIADEQAIETLANEITGRLGLTEFAEGITFHAGDVPGKTVVARCINIDAPHEVHVIDSH